MMGIAGISGAAGNAHTIRRYIDAAGIVAAAATFALGFALTLPGVALAAGDATSASCPASTESSPGFRSYLPDCRAYELVTPPYTEGYPVQLGYGTPAIAPSGAALLFSSLGTFAGAQESPVNAGAGAFYRASRTESGWATTSLEPTAAAAQTGEVLTGEGLGGLQFVADPTLATGAEVLSSTAAGALPEIYAREPGGSFRVIGPATALEATKVAEKGQSINVGGVGIAGEGASASLTHVLFTVNAEDFEDWPGDKTLVAPEFYSLYEYSSAEPAVGTEAAEPKLVGVTNAGALKTNTEAVQITQCGIRLAGTEDSGNTVSRSGATVFFNAEPGGCGEGEDDSGEHVTGAGPPLEELYARINGERTVDISEPSAEDCATCLTGLAEREKAAAELRPYQKEEFIGASEDGSKVFFTSYQELLPGITGANLYRFNFDAPAGQRLELISAALAGHEAEVEEGAVASAQGNRVYFTATGVLTKVPNAFGKTAEEGVYNLYMWEEAREGHNARLVYIAPGEGFGEGHTTSDGEFLVFRSYQDLTPNDTSGGYPAYQIFEYDAATGTLVRASVGQNGFNDDGNTSTDAAGRPFVSEDGRRIFFQSADSLAPGALNTQSSSEEAPQNIYEYTWQGFQPSEAEGEVYLISDGAGTSDIPPATGEYGSFLVGIDAEGENVFFRTVDDLVPQDTTTDTVIYDARVNGGFPGLSQASGCEASACQGEPPLSPALTAPSSATQPAGGNLALAPVVSAVRKTKRQLTRAQKLAKAVKGCQRDHDKSRRTSCQKRARQRYGKKRVSQRLGASKTQHAGRGK